MSEVRVGQAWRSKRSGKTVKAVQLNPDIGVLVETHPGHERWLSWAPLGRISGYELVAESDHGGGAK